MATSNQTKIKGTFLIGIVQTFYSLNALSELKIDALLTDIDPDGWYPIDYALRAFKALESSGKLYPKLLYQAGVYFIQAWFDNGGRDLALGSMGHLRLQDNSNGIKLVFKDYDPDKLYSKIITIDEEQGYAELELSDILPVEFMKGVFYNGIFMWDDLLWIDMKVDIIEEAEDYTRTRLTYHFKQEDASFNNKAIEAFTDDLSLDNEPSISEDMALLLAWRLKGMTALLNTERQINLRTNEMLGAALQEQITITEALKKAKDEAESANETIRKQSVIDFLTGLNNKRYFDDTFKKMWFSCMRRKELICVFMIDIDHFKLYNDSYGHLEGDQALKDVAKCLRETIHRSDDIIARFGGEEFVVAVVNSSVEQIELIAQKIMNRVEKEHIPHETSPVADYLTISIGTASCIPTKDHEPEDLIRCADNALYKGKELGRNKHYHISDCPAKQKTIQKNR